MGVVIYRWVLPPRVAGGDSDACAWFAVQDEGEGSRACDDLRDLLRHRRILSVFCPGCGTEQGDIELKELHGPPGGFRANGRSLAIFNWSSVPEYRGTWTTAPYCGYEIYCPAGHLLDRSDEEGLW